MSEKNESGTKSDLPKPRPLCKMTMKEKDEEIFSMRVTIRSLVGQLKQGDQHILSRNKLLRSARKERDKYAKALDEVGSDISHVAEMVAQLSIRLAKTSDSLKGVGR